MNIATYNVLKHTIYTLFQGQFQVLRVFAIKIHSKAEFFSFHSTIH